MYPRVSNLTLIHSASPLSVSAVKEMVELCGCVRVCGAGGDRESREAYECIHTLTMICFMSGH